jgi:hypothetical protein
MRPKNRTRLSLEALNDRINPSSFHAVHAGSNLVITQDSAASGEIVILDDPQSGSVDVVDLGAGGGTLLANTGGTTNLIVNLKSADTTEVLYTVESARFGSVTLNVKNSAARVLEISGAGSIGHNFTVVGGNGGLNVEDLVNPLQIGGNATFKGGKGADSLDLTSQTASIGGNLTLMGFNDLFLKGDSIGGGVTLRDPGELRDDFLSLEDTSVGGNLTYVGGAGADDVDFQGTTPSVHGNVTVNFGNQLAGDTSFFVQPAGLTSVIGGNLRVIGSNLGANDVIVQGVVTGNIALNLRNGTNTTVIDGTFLGKTVTYSGGSGVDDVAYEVLAGSSAARFTAHLGANNDSMTFGDITNVNPAFALVDFGAGADTVAGTIDFANKFLHLP